MLEPTEIAALASACFERKLLTGKHVLINAGPTREAIDPVRYISNHSSGKMGFALAEAAAEAGARVTLVAGPVHLPTPPRVDRINVISARDMQAACEAALPADIFIASAAVADYRPVDYAPRKLKKDPQANAGLVLELVPNPDILAEIASHAQRPWCVGFAAETHDVLAYARDKLTHKNLDLIIANDVSAPGIGFNSDDNAVTLIDRALHQEHLPQASKQKLARQIIGYIGNHLDAIE
jgi:phosphopantothenoylcysteine decarboxylase/phosphopantothenate--cysteine ligase